MGDARGGVILPFPTQRAQRASIELVTRLAPSRSLVDSLIAEAGLATWDAAAAMAAEFTYQARAMDAGYDRDTVIIKLRVLVDAQIAHAAEICLNYQESADRLIGLEIKAARAERLSGQMKWDVQRARADWRGRAIAARTAADAAQGAVRALVTYIRDGLDAPQPAAAGKPEQLPLFAAAVR
jgi:hypothetical protein